MTRHPLMIQGGLAAMVVVGGVLLAAMWPASQAVRAAAVAGVVSCAATGVLSLLFKTWARSLNSALLVVVMLFGLRAMVATAGAFLFGRMSSGALPFVWGFFGTYFPLQWVEVSYLLKVNRR